MAGDAFDFARLHFNLQIASQYSALTKEESTLLWSAIGPLATAFLAAVGTHRSQFNLGGNKIPAIRVFACDLEPNR